MRYTLYLRTPEGDSFLQKAAAKEDLQKSHATILRWIGQMNLVVRSPNQTTLVIADGNYGAEEARFISGGRRAWRPIADLEQMRIRAPAPTAATAVAPTQAKP